MAKRFTATEIWNEDWFLDMPIEYKLFWYYMLSTCNHAGLYKVNLRSFCGLNGVNLTSTKVLEYFNAGKQRIRVINNSLWLIEDFFVYQYGSTLNPNNRVHASIVKEYLKYGIELTSIRGLKDLKEGVKDKDKDKELISTNKDTAVLVSKVNSGFVCYNVEEYLLGNQLAFEKICMATSRKAEDVKKELHLYHLWLAKKEMYPMGNGAAEAGMESWLHNEKTFKQKYGVKETTQTRVEKLPDANLLAKKYG